MMIFTHIGLSLLFFSFYSLFFPSGVQILLISVLAAIIPDFDIFLDHRKNFHFPLVPLLFLPFTLGFGFLYASIFLFNISLHSLSELLANDADDFRDADKGAVYDHLRGKWLHGSYIISLDGSKEDLFATAVFCLIAYLLNSVTLPVGLFCIIGGSSYYLIRDNVSEIFPEFLLR